MRGGGGGIINGGGEAEKPEEKVEIWHEMYEIKRIMADFGKSKNIFLKSLVWGRGGGGGGYNKLKSLEKNWKIGNNPPSYNYGSESKWLRKIVVYITNPL